MVYLKECDTVYKLVSLPRWQKDWINDQNTINFSGMIQEMLNDIIERNDPEYFQKKKHNIAKRQHRRHETTMIALRKSS